jgi:NAD(P)-dependent dehydrogenase (short-subunit alcohol dehydrogenase family)
MTGVFDGMAALVTGAGSGIGAATAELIAEQGGRVAAFDIADTTGSTQVLSIRGDVRDQASIDDGVERTIREFGRLDVLVNCAGIGSVGDVEAASDDEWSNVFNVNLFGVVRMVRACLPHIKASPVGTVVNVSSILATIGVPNRACYAASKGALYSLTFAMAADLATQGVRVNCVMPGTIGTPWVERLLGGAADPEGERKRLTTRQPLGRLGNPGEVARAIAFLASPYSGFVTGTALAIDGGMSGLRIPSE